MESRSWSGTFTAIVTPFADGAVDLPTLHHLVERQVQGGVEGIVPCGTTGESATLTREEHLSVVRAVVEASSGRVQVVAGAGGSSTAAVVGLARDVAACGVDGLLSVVPAYNKPNPAGLLEHFTAVADAVDVPIMLYNVPGRTARDMMPDTVLRLAEHPNVVAVKESSGSVTRVMDLIAGAPTGFRVFSGDDDHALPSIALGAKGLVSVAANEAPRAVSDMVRAALSGDLEAARAAHYRLLPLLQANFVDTNPIPVKAALHALGLVRDEIRLPLVWASADTTRAVRDALADAGVDGART